MGKKEQFKEITEEMYSLYEYKNARYRDSFAKSMKNFGVISPVIRISDKLNRLENLADSPEIEDNESIIDTLIDIANYAVMALIEVKSDEK